MSSKGLRVLFIALNANVLCLSEKQSDCACVTFDWKEFGFSFLPENYEHWKENICSPAQLCLEKINSTVPSTVLKNNTSCKRRPINVTFPVILSNPKPNTSFIALKMLSRPVLAMKEVSSSTASQVLLALGQIWRLLAFCLMCAVLSGIMIWFLVSVKSTCMVSHFVALLIQNPKLSVVFNVRFNLYCIFIMIS